MSHLFPRETSAPVPTVSAARRRRQGRLYDWHAEWFAGQVAKGVDGPVPTDRPVESDYNLHVPDLDASGADLDTYFDRAREILATA